MPPTSHIYSATDLFRDSHSSFMIISESDCLALLVRGKWTTHPRTLRTTEQGTLHLILVLILNFPLGFPMATVPHRRNTRQKKLLTQEEWFSQATAHHHRTASLSTSASSSYVVVVGILAFEEIDSQPITDDVIRSHVTHPPTPPFQGIDKWHPPHCSITDRPPGTSVRFVPPVPWLL